MRKFTWCRQELAEFCMQVGKHAHVCITSPEGRVISPECGYKALNLSFHDLEPGRIRQTEAYGRDSVRGEELIKRCFTEAQAHEIVAFVNKTDKDETIIVNCEAGISRSPGVVLAYRTFLGEEIESIYKRADPNQHVAAVLGKVLRESNS